MHDNVVHRSAQRIGIGVARAFRAIVQKRRRIAAVHDEFAGDAVERERRHSRAHLGLQVLQHGAKALSAFRHDCNFLRGS